MKIVVTGCAGMIGCYLTSELLISYPKNDGHKIIGIDNLSRGKLSNLKEACGDKFDDLIFIKADLTIFDEKWVKYFYQSNVVIHLADIVAGIGYVFENESYVFRTNLLINSNLTKAIYESRPNRYIYVGTACSFPKKLQLSVSSKPLVEEDQFPAEPESGYGWSKLMGEFELELATKLNKIEGGTIRLHNVYGPPCEISEEKSQVIPALIRKLLLNEEFIVWGSGKQRRAFLYVDDVIDGISKYINHGFGNGCIQLSPEESTSISDIAHKLVDISKKNVNIHFDTTKPEGDKDRTGNIDKAKEILNWSPKTNIDDGLEKTYRWISNYLKNMN